MNENINLVEILKDCPKRTKFYSSVYGELIYSGMYTDSLDPKIYFIDENIRSTINGSPLVIGYYRDGRLYATKGECTIFPSKDQRDWSKFTAPWLKKERDKDKLIQELGKYKVKYTQEVLEKYINSMNNKDDERLRKTTIAFLKDFAEQGYENATECIDWLKKQSESSQTNERAWLYLVSDVLTWKDGIGQYLDDPRVQELAKRLCSEYAQKLYNPSVLSNSSNTRKNEQKFDPKTLKPFDKVLVRIGSNSHWTSGFFSHIADNSITHKYVTQCGSFNRCIPYNDETKYLVGTTIEAPEYYRYWEN